MARELSNFQNFIKTALNSSANTTHLVPKTIPIEISMFVVYTVYPALQMTIPILGLIGFIGFIGNAITFLQPELRSNTCCIYILCSSSVDLVRLAVTIFPFYFQIKYSFKLPWDFSTALCKFFYFLYNFLPQLAINLLILSLLDRFACSCPLTSRMHRLNQLKMVPLMIFIVIIISSVVSIYGPILAYIPIDICNYTEIRVYGLLNIFINGVIQPIVMLVLVLFTYRNVRQSRQRVGAIVTSNANRSRNQFMAMIITQVLVTAVLSLIFLAGQTYVFLTYDSLKTLEDFFTVYFFFSFTLSLYAMNNVKLFFFSMLTSKLYRQTFVKAWKRLFVQLGCLQHAR